MKRIRVAVAVFVVVVLAGFGALVLGAAAKEAAAESLTYTVRGTVYDFETEYPLGKYRHIPEITKPVCGSWYEIRDQEGNLLAEGLAVNIIEQRKMLVGEEVDITVFNLLGHEVLCTVTGEGFDHSGYVEGDFRFKLPAGSYRAVFRKEGYESNEIALIVPWPGAEEFQYEIFLTPKVSYMELSPTLPDPS